MIKLRNTLTRTIEEFKPIDANNVRIYACGPTVYDRAHLGNARSAVVFDALVRLLRHEYGHKNVRYARNITDVDDKINARAKEAGRPIGEITTETTLWYHEDMGALGVRPPDDEPRATEYIQQMQNMITVLLEKNYAYEAEGHVLFDVTQYSAYGALSGRSLEDMIAGARVEVVDFKRHPQDFVLWKPAGDGPGWESPWGFGRPGWHIECSAMSKALLGDEFDIHTGGIDLEFPHHENEIAQSCCANGTKRMANYWVHNEMLQVEGKKMSKSLGNFFTVRDLLDQGIPGEVIRFVLLSTHYSKPMDWTEKKREEAEKTLRKWRGKTRELENDAIYLSDAKISDEFLNALRDDLNTSKAIAVLHDLFNQGDYGSLKKSAEVLGFLTKELSGWNEGVLDSGFEDVRSYLLAEMTMARQEKNYALSDRIRDAFIAAGFEVSIIDNRPHLSGSNMSKSDEKALLALAELKDELAQN